MERPLPIDPTGPVEPEALSLAPLARGNWRCGFPSKVKEARSFGESRDLQDVSRSFCYGVGGDVPLNGRPMRRTRSWKRGSARSGAYKGCALSSNNAPRLRS